MRCLRHLSSVYSQAERERVRQSRLEPPISALTERYVRALHVEGMASSKGMIGERVFPLQYARMQMPEIQR